MKYILKEDYMPDAISGVDSKIMDAMQKGKPFDCDRLPKSAASPVDAMFI